jgi:HD superfamily phosphohydrolase
MNLNGQELVFWSNVSSMNDKLKHHLENDFLLPVRDPIWQHIYLSHGLMKLIKTQGFLQLSRIKQLGPAHLVYPGATHSRYSHSLGVFHGAKKILHKLISHPKCPPITLEGGKAFLCAALLHDLGHFPYTHSLKELPLKEHEQLTGELVLSDEISRVIAEQVQTDPVQVAKIVDVSLPCDDWETNYFRSILSSPLDPDKLDYLTRDAYFCGVPYGTQDMDFILSRIHPSKQDGIALDEQGISAIEHLLFSKYLMYRSVYWHRDVRIATGMIKKALFLGLTFNKIQPDDLYHLDDETFYRNIKGKNEFPPFQLIDQVHEGKLFHILTQTPFNPLSPLHNSLTKLDQRRSMEEAIVNFLSNILGKQIEYHQLVLDIPEAVSFEINMPIITTSGDEVLYSSVPSVFSKEVIQQFTQTLRIIRIALEPPIVKELLSLKTSFDCEELLEQLATPVDLS